MAGVVGGGERVFAHKAQYPILDVRTLQDFALDDVAGGLLRASTRPTLNLLLLLLLLRASV